MAGPFDHPDAQRRFRVMSNLEELERALDYPWDKWTVFLYPRSGSWLSAATTAPPAFGVSRNRKDNRGASPRGLPCTGQPGCQSAPNHILRHSVQRPENQTSPPDQQRTASGRACGSPRHERDCAAALRTELRPPQIAPRETIQKVLAEAAGAVEGHKFSLASLPPIIRRRWETTGSSRHSTFAFVAPPFEHSWPMLRLSLAMRLVLRRRRREAGPHLLRRRARGGKQGTGYHVSHNPLLRQSHGSSKRRHRSV